MTYITNLVALRRRSIRRGIWFRILNKFERAQVDLTVRIVKKVRSSGLAKVLNLIVEKLSDALESRVSKMVKLRGRSLAQEVSKVALDWGYKSAKNWASDLNFARFLAIMNLNGHPPC
ncbi:MAG: hypothetical protein JSV05_04040 [Candidatus Bathyarchaeota archaeon]|nr:MAG: hypothetical protein JSV05_04040 [Candidatus Bathyarchaeota archaeon]